MQEKIIEELRQELKEQIKENQELEKKVDGLVTVIDLVRYRVLTYADLNRKREELLEILERVNESEVK